jgi:hypothetical protein
MAAQFPQVGAGIKKERTLSKDAEAVLRRAIDEYKKVVGK